MIHSRMRENERATHELEDKLNRAQDESDEYRRKYEKLEKTVWELRR